MMVKNEKPVRARGGCLCGAIRYTVRGPLRDVVACHCTQCRRMSGHHFAASAARRGDLEIADETKLVWYRASDEAARGFCGVCGSSLFWKADAGEVVGILAGSLDTPTGLKLAAHIFVGDKGDYYELSDDVPHHQGHSHGIAFPDE